MRSAALSLVVGVLVASLAPAAGAQAAGEQARAAVRELGYQGVTLYQQGDAAGASALLERAYQTLKVPTLALWSARALRDTGRLVEASERYFEATRLPLPDVEADVHAAAQRDAAAERDILLPRLAHVDIVVEGRGGRDVDVRIDDRLVPAALLGMALPVDPGERRIVVAVEDTRQERTVTVAEGERVTARFEIAPSPEPELAPTAAPPEPAPIVRTPSPAPGEPMADDASLSTQSVLGWTATGVGAAALLVGGGFYVDAAVRYGDLACTDGVCGPASEVDIYNRSRVLGVVGLGVGGALVVTGLVLLLTDGGGEGSTARITPWVSLSEPGAGVAATF